MRNSIKKSIICLYLAVVVIVYITTIMLSNRIIDINNVLAINNIIILIILLLVALIPAIIISRMIVYPLKKIEKNMRTVAAGKVVDTKHLKGYEKIAEINNTVEAFKAMMEVINKNNFDLNGQQSKTEIILEHMTDFFLVSSVSGNTCFLRFALTLAINSLTLNGFVI